MTKRGGARKAQVSIFLIIAVLLMLAGGTWFVYNNVVSEQAPDVPEDIRPVHTFTANCLEQVTEDGLRRIGATGGYIDVPEQLRNNPRATLQATPIEELKQPYWWFDGIQAEPDLEHIRGQLQEHVQQNIHACLDNYSVFESQFTFTYLEEPQVEILFSDEDVQARLDYEMEIRARENQTGRAWDSFTATIPVRFKKMHELASKIMQRQVEEKFIEQRAIDLMSLDPGRIPITEIEFSCEEQTWQVSSVRQRIQELLAANIPYIKIQGSGESSDSYVSNPFGEDVYGETYFQTHFVWDVGIEDTEGIKAGFTYDPAWETVVNARPSEAGVMHSGSNTGSGLLDDFCVQISHFTYDVQFPIQVAVTDDRAVEPYVFTFAFKADIDHNLPKRQAKGYSIFSTPDRLTTTEYCGDRDTEVTVFTVDNVTGEDIKDVDLSFTCGRYSCDIGVTDWLSFGAAAGLTEQYPYCVNGILRGERDGYLEAEQFIQTNSDGESYILFLQPVKEFEILSVRKHPAGDPGTWELLGPGEEVTMQLRDTGGGHRTSAVVPSATEPTLQLHLDKERTYEVSLRLLEDDEVIGGYEGTWKPSLSGLRGADELRLHVIEAGPDMVDDQAGFLLDLREDSGKIPGPELIIQR